MTAEEKQVLNFPGPNATQDERDKWGEKVQSLGKTADVLEINNCITSPTVVLVQNGTEIKVKNSGKTEITLFALGGEYNIAPGNTTPIKVNPKEGKGNHGYGCIYIGGSRIPETSGIFLVI